MRIMCAYVGLSLTPHVQVYLCRAAVINAGDNIRAYLPLMTNLSTRRYLEYMHMLFTVKFF